LVTSLKLPESGGTSIVTVSSLTRLPLASSTVAVTVDLNVSSAGRVSGTASTVTEAAGPGVRVILTVPETPASVAVAVIVTVPAVVPAV